MTDSIRRTRSDGLALGAALLVAVFSGCRSNVGSLFSVATGRADVSAIAAAANQRQAVAPATPGVATPGEAPVAVPPAVNQASFAGNANATPGAATGSNLFAPVDPTTGNPAPPPTRDEALAAILGDLRQLGEVNPAAQQALLAQLETADPTHWPLLVRRVRADLAVSQQLRTAADATPAGQGGSGRRPPRASAAPPTTRQPATAQPTTSLPPAPLTHDSHQHGSSSRPGTTTSAAAGAPPIDTPASFAAPATRPEKKVDPAVRLVSAYAATGPVENPYFESESAAALASERSPGHWRVELAQAINALQTAAVERPQSAAEAYEHARLRLLQLASGDLDAAATAIPGLSSTEQAYWSQQLFALATLMDAEAQPETKRRAAAARRRQADASSELAQLSSLAVRELTFCREVYGYGAYEPVESTAFRPGQQVTLYAEVDNYQSVSTDEGRHTSLATSYRIVDDEGDRLDGADFPVVDDYCLSHRRDFHIQYTVPLPTGLKPGNYRLELTINDQLGHKMGHASTEFSIGGPIGASGTR